MKYLSLAGWNILSLNETGTSRQILQQRSLLLKLPIIINKSFIKKRILFGKQCEMYRKGLFIKLKKFFKNLAHKWILFIWRPKNNIAVLFSNDKYWFQHLQFETSYSDRLPLRDVRRFSQIFELTKVN